MTKYKDYQPEQQKNTLTYVNQRWSQLYHLQKDWSERAVTYLFTANGTGAIALLSFIGALKNVKGETICALGCFLLGIVLVGALTAMTYHKMYFLFFKWRVDARAYLENQEEWEEINKKDEVRVGNNKSMEIVAYSSFGLFILGLIFGVLGILGLPFFETMGSLVMGENGIWRTFIQVLALAMTLISSYFLIKSILCLSLEDLAELSILRYDSQFENAKNICRQRSNTIIGFVFLLLSIIMTLFNMLWEMSWADEKTSKIGLFWAVITGLIMWFIALKVSDYLSKNLYQKVEAKIKTILKK